MGEGGPKGRVRVPNASQEAPDIKTHSTLTLPSPGGRGVATRPNVVAALRSANHGGMRARGRKTDFNYLHLQLLGRFPRCIETHVRYNEVDERFALLPEARSCVRA